MATLEEMGLLGFKQTQAEVKKLEPIIIKEYQDALTAINKDLRKIYDKVIGDLTPTQLAALMKDNPAWLFTEAAKFNRLTDLEKAVREIYLKTSLKAANQTVEAGKLSMINNFFKQQFALDFAAIDPLSFAVLNPAVVEASVLGTTKIWDDLRKATQDRIDDTFGNPTKYISRHGTLSATLIKNRTKDLADIKTAIDQGLIQGKSFTRTAKDVKKILDGSASQALTVVRTESGRNSNSGHLANTNQARSQGLDVRRQIVSVLDDRTRPQSQQVDLRLENDEGFFTYPGGLLVAIPGNSGVASIDINDRERTIDIIDGQEPDTRVGRNPLTGKNETMSFKSYDDWMKDNGFTQNATGRWIPK